MHILIQLFYHDVLNSVHCAKAETQILCHYLVEHQTSSVIGTKAGGLFYP
jgi:hypothetical protein